MALLKPDFLVNHPVPSGLVWAAFFLLTMAVINLIQGDTESLPALFVMAVTGGIAWGYFMRWWHRRNTSNIR